MCLMLESTLELLITSPYSSYPHPPTRSSCRRSCCWSWCRRCLASRARWASSRTRSRRRGCRTLGLSFSAGLGRLGSLFRCGGGPFHWCIFRPSTCGECWGRTTCGVRTWWPTDWDPAWRALWSLRGGWARPPGTACSCPAFSAYLTSEYYDSDDGTVADIKLTRCLI